MILNECPDRQTLRSFGIGVLAAQRAEAVSLHVENCQSCLAILEQLAGNLGDLALGELGMGPPGAGDKLPDENATWVAAAHAGLAAVTESHPRFSIDAGQELARQLARGPVLLDRFELRAELGVGSFGYVFQAWDPRLERMVAIKVQRAGALASEEEVQRFMREARSAAQLKHASIVSLHEFGRTDDGVCFLVSEFIDGETLEEVLQRGAIAPATAAAIAIELALALQFAHQHGVIHRDVKPSNVMIDRAGRAYLMDFGLAKRDSGEPTVTSDGRLMGTPAYMSPEQAAGTSRAVGPATDIYSLGVVLYEMLTGERPFHGNRRLVLLQVLEDEPRPPRSLKPGLPRDLEVICQTAMHKSAARRYARAAALADDLRRFREGLPILARPPGRVERALRWCRRYPLAVSTLLAVLLGSLAGLWYLSSLSEFFVRQTALASARLETKMLDEVWRFYSEEISDIDTKSTNVTITENYKTVHPALPLPATFAIDLGERISRRSPGMEVRVFSRYPWPDRKDGGPQDEFDAAALAWLEQNASPQQQPPAEYPRFITAHGRRKLLYYTAQHIEQSCLGCHNHRDSKSPKKDWKVGEVVGVLKIVRPLDDEIASTRTGFRGAFALMVLIAALFLGLSLAVSVIAQRRRKAALA